MQYLPLHLVGLSSFKTTSKYMKFCLQMNKKGRPFLHTKLSLPGTQPAVGRGECLPVTGHAHLVLLGARPRPVELPPPEVRSKQRLVLGHLHEE